MKPKMERVYAFYQTRSAQFQCPNCHGRIKVVEPASIICENGHCCDISKYGDVNYLPNQKQTKYSKELFESRRIVFEKGYYQPLVTEICQMIQGRMQNDETFSLLDAGCGEGYYADLIQRNLDTVAVYAVDNMKEAVRMGAKKNKSVSWLVANLAALPLRAKTMDMILEIFAPSNYLEFKRVLKQNGCLVKVIPGEGYLKELRMCLDVTEKQGEAYSSQRVEEYFGKQFPQKTKHRVTYTRMINKEMRQHFLQMTPMMFSRDASVVNMERLTQLTFDFVILLGEKK